MKKGLITKLIFAGAGVAALVWAFEIDSAMFESRNIPPAQAVVEEVKSTLYSNHYEDIYGIQTRISEARRLSDFAPEWRIEDNGVQYYSEKYDNGRLVGAYLDTRLNGHILNSEVDINCDYVRERNCKESKTQSLNCDATLTLMGYLSKCDVCR